MALKFMYTIFVGILVATFVGVGIAAFYTAPKPPDYPTLLERPKAALDGRVEQETVEEQAAREQYDRDQKVFMEANGIYNRNVSTMALIAAVLVLVVSLTFARKILLLADGLLLGGTLTLFYSLIRGFMTDDVKYRFIVVTIGLIITLILGYLKFTRAEKETAE